MKTISMELQDSFYDDLEACAISNGFTSLNHCFIYTMEEKVEAYRAKVAGQNIDKSDFIQYVAPVIEENPDFPE